MQTFLKPLFTAEDYISEGNRGQAGRTLSGAADRLYGCV